MRSSRLLLVLGLLVAAAAAVFAFILMQQTVQPGGGNGEGFATPTPPNVVVLYARRDIEAGEIISDTGDLFKELEVAATEFEQGNFVRASEASELQGMKLLRPLARNQPLREEQVGPLGLAEMIPEGKRAYPIKVNTLAGVGDLVVENDRVDILASFPLRIVYLRPGNLTIGENMQGTIEIKEDFYDDNSTKTLLQDIQVLRILRRPAAPPAGPNATPGTPAPEGQQPPPATPIPGLEAHPQALATALQPGEWLLLLALTDQEAEVLKYSVDKGAVVNLALRPTGERDTVTTTGVTFHILTRDHGVPIPQPLDLSRAEALEETPTLPTPEPLGTVTATPSRADQ